MLYNLENYRQFNYNLSTDLFHASARSDIAVDSSIEHFFLTQLLTLNVSHI